MSKNREFWYFLLQGTLDDKIGVYSNFYTYGTHCGDCLAKAMKTAEKEGVIKPELIETCRLDNLEGFKLPENAIEMNSDIFMLSTFNTYELKKEEKPLAKLVEAESQSRYRVRSGDFLGKIAEKFGVRVSEIKRWNGLRSNNLKIGQRLTIYSRNSKAIASAKPQYKKKSIPPGAKTHTVQSGDSLWTISQKYSGISVDNLKDWNGISGKNLKLGTKIMLCDCSEKKI